MKKIIILSIIFIIILTVSIILVVRTLRVNTKIISENNELKIEVEEYKKERKTILKEIEELNNKKPITKETIKYISNDNKNKIILKQKEIIQKDTDIIDKLNTNLDKTNNELKKSLRRHNISFFTLVGIDSTTFEFNEKLNLDIYIGATYRKSFNHFFFGCGGAVKIYTDPGGAFYGEIGFSF